MPYPRLRASRTLRPFQGGFEGSAASGAPFIAYPSHLLTFSPSHLLTFSLSASKSTRCRGSLSAAAALNAYLNRKGKHRSQTGTIESSLLLLNYTRQSRRSTTSVLLLSSLSGKDVRHVGRS